MKMGDGMGASLLSSLIKSGLYWKIDRLEMMEEELLLRGGWSTYA
jgi:hypothetical protein